MTASQRNFVESLWDFFCSLKLTMFLLISLALTSIIGTVLPQGPVPPEYIAQISPLKLKIYSNFGFFDMYHSMWFIALLYIFSLNLICCSIKRLPHVFTYISAPMLVLSESLQKAYTRSAELRFNATQDAARNKLADFLKAEFTAPTITEHGGELHLFAQKSAWSRLGVYVVHASILVIFIGAIIGSLFGDKGVVNIIEGESVSGYMSRNGTEKPLGFTVRCDQFTVTKYPNGAPKEFKSILTVLEHGVPVTDYVNARVIVNDPMTYKGFTFYQSSYGQAGDVSDAQGGGRVGIVEQGMERVRGQGCWRCPRTA